jgi:dihydrofolate reductase
MTRYDVEYKADTFFPNIDEDDSWEIKEESEVKIYDGGNYKSFVYKRVNK